MRTPVFLAALLAAALAAPAEAKLVYVKEAASASPVVYVASNAGKHPRRLGVGRAPTVSPDGRWVAFVTVPSTGSRMDTVVLQKLESGAQRLVMRSKQISSLRFSPDSKLVAAVAAGVRVRVYDIAADELHVAAVGDLRGYGFSPDSEQIVFGEADGDDLQARSDLFVAPATGGEDPDRLTDTHDAVNPVWGPGEVFFDRFKKRAGDAPAFNLWAVVPKGNVRPRRLTRLTIPPLTSGLVPLEVSHDSRRLLTVFTGQDAEVGFTVDARSGRTRALSRDFEHGLVGFDLSRGGATILAHTGGPDPSSAHDVVTLPWRGGATKLLVRDAAYPDWSR